MGTVEYIEQLIKDSPFGFLTATEIRIEIDLSNRKTYQILSDMMRAEMISERQGLYFLK